MKQEGLHIFCWCTVMKCFKEGKHSILIILTKLYTKQYTKLCHSTWLSQGIKDNTNLSLSPPSAATTTFLSPLLPSWHLGFVLFELFLFHPASLFRFIAMGSVQQQHAWKYWILHFALQRNVGQKTWFKPKYQI